MNDLPITSIGITEALRSHLRRITKGGSGPAHDYEVKYTQRVFAMTILMSGHHELLLHLPKQDFGSCIDFFKDQAKDESRRPGFRARRQLEQDGRLTIGNEAMVLVHPNRAGVEKFCPANYDWKNVLQMDDLKPASESGGIVVVGNFGRADVVMPQRLAFARNWPGYQGGTLEKAKHFIRVWQPCLKPVEGDFSQTLADWHRANDSISVSRRCVPSEDVYATPLESSALQRNPNTGGLAMVFDLSAKNGGLDEENKFRFFDYCTLEISERHLRRIPALRAAVRELQTELAGRNREHQLEPWLQMAMDANAQDDAGYTRRGIITGLGALGLGAAAISQRIAGSKGVQR